jgi:hypothetical protein
MVGGMAFAAAPAGAAKAHPLPSTTVNVLTDHVTCDTLIGTISFGTKLTLTGPTTGPNTTTVKATVSGCTDDDHNGTVGQVPLNYGVFSGTLGGVLTTTGGSSCVGLLGPGSATGVTTNTWKNPTGYILNPLDPTNANKPTSKISISQDQGGTFVVDQSAGPWDGTGYGFFSIGTAYGTTAPSQTGANNLFKGSDSGGSGWFAGTTNQGVGALLAGCGKGISKITFGIGSLHEG